LSQSLIAFDTDHIKGYVFGTNKLREIRGASSLLDSLNREETEKAAKGFGTEPLIYANGGSALFMVDSNEQQDSTQRAVELGKEVQRLYREKTGGGTSISYAIQLIPAYTGEKDIREVEELDDGVLMKDVLHLLRVRLRLAKDSLGLPRDANMTLPIAQPSYALLCTCESCGVNYAEYLMADNDNPEGRYCRVCKGKRVEDKKVRDQLDEAKNTPVPEHTLWGRILNELKEVGYDLTDYPQRPEDFNVFRSFTHGKEYLGLIYADANSMGIAIANQKSLNEAEKFAALVDGAVFKAVAYAINQHLPVQNKTFPFDILMVGGDDIVMVTPADKAMQVAHTLAEKFHELTKQYTLSVGVVLAPVKYPFSLQRELVEATLKAAKKSGAQQPAGSSDNKREESRVNFVVVTGNTSLGYEKEYEGMHRKEWGSTKEFYATMRPYTLSDLDWLLGQLRQGNTERLGRTKLHQLREAILKLDHTTSIVESLALFRNWKQKERDFMRKMVERFDKRKGTKQESMGPLFPWSLDGEGSSENLTIYRTPLLDFIDLYDFVTS